jgi:cell division protein FtsQ
MNPGEPLSTRAPRMKTYREMVAELDSGGARYSQDLSEVDLTDLEDLKVRVNDHAGDVLVHLGSSDYLRRYKIYVTHAQAWRRQFQKLESVDLRYDNQIIVNPDMERTAKMVALSPSAAKTAAAAGVKPAALLTRMGPHDRALPKPAFELTQKKLDGKAPAGGTKKPTARTKRKKTPANGAKATAGAKKAGLPGKDGRSLAPKKSASGGPKPSAAIARSQTSQGPAQ